MELGGPGNETANSLLELKKKLADTKNAIEMPCNDKDVVLLLGNTGSGKSVLYNYLLNVPLKECSAADVGIEGLQNQKYITGDTTKKYIDPRYSEIGHTGDSLTATPVISVLNDMALCDCPGFKDNRGTTHLLANTVKITRVLKSSRSCKIIIVIAYNEVAENRLTSLREISDRISRMFLSEDLFHQHCKSIRFLITKLPKLYEGEVGKAENIQRILLRSNFINLRCIAANPVLIYDPLSRNDRSCRPIPTREELIEAIKSIPSISNPIKAFGMGLSDSEDLAIREFEKIAINYINELTRKKEMLMAAIFYQIFFHLEVLEHETVKTACANLRTTAVCVLSEMKKEFQEKAMKEAAENAKEILEEFGTILKAFERPGSDAVLMEMWNKYIDFKRMEMVKYGAAGVGAVWALGAATAVLIIFPPFIPLGVLGGCLIGGGVAGGATAAIAGFLGFKSHRLSEAESPKTKEVNQFFSTFSYQK